MNQLDSLTGYLKNALGERMMSDCEIVTDDTTVIIAEKNSGLGQRRVAVCTCNALFIWPAWPYREISPALLPALVCCWIADNQPLREQLALAAPVISRDPGDNHRSVVITLDVDLYGEIVICEDERGNIVRDGARYRLADETVWTAQEAEIVTA